MKTIFLVTDRTDYNDDPVVAFESETDAFELVMALYEEVAYENFCFDFECIGETKAWEKDRNFRKKDKFPFFVIHKVTMMEG